MPGQYTIRLVAGNNAYEAKLQILQDPQSEATPEDLREQLDFQLQLRDMSSAISALINRIEWVRKDMIDMRQRFGTNETYSTPIDLGIELEQALMGLEMKLFDLRLTGGSARQDTIRWPRQLWAKISSLVQYSAGSDHKPTDQSLEVMDLYRTNIEQFIIDWNDFENVDLRTFNDMLAEYGLTPVGR